VTGLIHVLTKGEAEICERVNPCVDKKTGRNFLPVSLSTHGLSQSHISPCPLVNIWINPVTYFWLSPCQHMDKPCHIFLPVHLSTHRLIQSHISACPLVNTWLNPLTYFCLSPCHHLRQNYMTGLIHVLTRRQVEICDRVNPWVDKRTGRNM
jgi:hypothetical protein